MTAGLSQNQITSSVNDGGGSSIAPTHPRTSHGHRLHSPRDSAEPYRAGTDGLFRLETPPAHRDDEYDSTGIDILRRMQADHFWYRGRHRFLLRAFFDEIQRQKTSPADLRCIDLGCGCGGWIEYLLKHSNTRFGELSLADSSLKALEYARQVVGESVPRYQVDLLDLQWRNRWDVAFLLDVLEHIPEDREALQQIYRALKPEGLLFVTTPALNFFWSYNDDLAHHVRRYSRGDYVQLARQTGFQLRLSRYFMFFLSPLLFLSRLRKPDLQTMTAEEIQVHLRRTHRVPAAPVNRLLEFVFACETPSGLRIPFPWGTSILAVLQKPA